MKHLNCVQNSNGLVFADCEHPEAGEVSYVTLDTTTIFLIKNGYHCFSYKEKKWYCQNCRVCKLKSTLRDILAQEQLYNPVPLQYLDYSTVSAQPIPYKLSKDCAKTYDE